jgi:Ca-activated chloride channel homolog
MKIKLQPFFYVISALFLITTFQQVHAVGALYVRPRFSSDQYQNMSIKSINVSVEMQDQVSVTSVDQVFYNEMTTSVEAIYIFPLPDNAMITKLVYWFNGQSYVASIREKQDATNAYNSKVRQWMDPALLEYLGNNLFKLSIVPVNAQSEVRAQITYVEMLQYNFGMVNYKFLLNTMQLSPKPVDTVHLLVDAVSQNPFKYFISPSHGKLTDTKIIKYTSNHYTLEFGDENFTPDKDLTIQFETLRDQVRFNLLTYTPSPQDSMGTSSFYTLWVTPPDSIPGEEVIPKDIVFAVDVSSSMEGPRLTQVKTALYNFLALLNSNDRFNILSFGTFINKFKPDLVPVTPDNIAAARNYVYQLYALGLTDIDDALTQSMQQSYDKTSLNNIVFLTDGQPTWGVTNTDSIVSHAQINNKNNIRLFSFGVGEDVSVNLLTSLSSLNHGSAQFIKSDDSISTIVSDQFNRMSKPVMQNISIDLGGLQAWDQYPKTIDDLFWGSQVIQLGLYDNTGTFSVTLKGDERTKSVQFSNSISFADTLGGYRFVPRLWAKSKIDYLLGQISMYGESPELVKQVTDLSLRFQILTPYSAFYSDPTSVDQKKDLPDEFSLKQNYPNPFNPSTVIEYYLPSKAAFYHVTINIYNILGQLIARLVDREEPAGIHRITWDGKDLNGRTVASGIYFYSMRAGDYFKTKKMIMLR